MKRPLLATVAMGLALLLPAPAFACDPIPAKTWRGSLQMALPQLSVSNTVFSSNGCEWPDPSLNGVDAIVFDVSSHKGLAGNVTWSTDAPVKPDQLYGYFRTASCELIADPTWSTSGQALSFPLPSTAKWLIVQAVGNRPSKDITVTISSPGRKCPAGG